MTLLSRGPTPAAFRPDDGILIALTIATALSLALLWWSPLSSLSITVGLLVAQSLAGYNYTWAAVMAVVVASFVTVLFDEWRRAVAGGFVVTGGFVFLWLTGTGISWQELAARWITLSAVWSLACVLRIYRASAVRAERRAELFAADRDARAREAVAQERARMARELHDSVGHALNVVVLHAGAAQRVVATKPELVQQALDNIETAGRQALGDIERMLGILRADDEEACCDADPGMDQIEDAVRPGAGRGPARRAHRRRARSWSSSLEPRPDGVPHRAGVAHEHAQARRPHARVGEACTTSPMRSSSTSWMRAAAWRRERRSAADAAFSACVNG